MQINIDMKKLLMIRDALILGLVFFTILVFTKLNLTIIIPPEEIFSPNEQYLNLYLIISPIVITLIITIFIKINRLNRNKRNHELKLRDEEVKNHV